jgi:hypothetical protein
MAMAIDEGIIYQILINEGDALADLNQDIMRKLSEAGFGGDCTTDFTQEDQIKDGPKAPRFAEDRKFRLDDFCSSRASRRYRGFKEARTSWVGNNCEVLSTLQPGTAPLEYKNRDSLNFRARTDQKLPREDKIDKEEPVYG